MAFLLVGAVAACDSEDEATTSTITPPPTATTVAPMTAVAEVSEDQQRLDRLVEWLDQQREATHVPGLAIAVVRDGEVILAEGLGLADMESGTPVTPETLFPIGSSTKAFTTTLAGMLVDDGVISWDDPVTDYLPYFSLAVESNDPDAQITLRDMLSHRTGFTRMSVLIANPEVPVEQMLREAVDAEPWAPFRERFYYTNVMYTAAGTAIAEAAESSWPLLVEDRILDPLGMDDTTASSMVAMADEQLATGYSWDADLEELDPLDFRPVDNICPAGCLNSTVLDMAEWLRLQLAEGEFNGGRIISEEQLEQTRTQHTEIGGDISYGLGWLLSEWQDEPQVAHGGNVTGFSAQVAMLPDSNLGFVMLTNVSITPLQDLVIPAVWDALLGELEEDTVGEVTDFEPYLGEYVANFGQFRDERFEVLLKDGKLAIDIPNQQVFELLSPDDEGLWQFALTEEIAVSFVREDDQVVAMELYQAGLVFEMPRVGHLFTPEIPLEDLQRYLGGYHSDELDLTATVLIQNNRLAIDWPQEMVYELYPPNEDGVWVFRVTPDFILEFEEGAEGTVEALTYRQPGFEARFVHTDEAPTPTIEQLRALHRYTAAGESLEDHSAWRMTGIIRVPQSGIEGSFTTVVDGLDRFRAEQDFGDFGSSLTTVNETEGWVVPSFGPEDELHGQILEQLRGGHPLAFSADWWDFFDEVAVVRATTLDEASVYVVTMRRGELPLTTAYVDAQSGDVVRTEQVTLVGDGVMIPVNTVYEDFRVVAGLRIPFRTTSSNEHTGSAVVEIELVETDVEAESGWFEHTP